MVLGKPDSHMQKKEIKPPVLHYRQKSYQKGLKKNGLKVWM